MPAAIPTLMACSVCGEPMNGECLLCLLRGGLGEDSDGAFAYGDFEIEPRDDGSLWELGSGAMGVTYRARDKVLHRAVALKVIEIPATTSDAEAIRARFLREARAAAALKHPNVAGIFHFGTSASGDRCYYAMELVEGETLEALVRREGPLPPAQALEIAIQVAHALVTAAAQGLIHRDLKPGNIMIVRSARALEVKVIDFGLAKTMNAVAEADLTHGGFIGTPAFASPEQFIGVPADARSDIYSLGATLWYALTGEVPFPGKAIFEIQERQRTTPLPIHQLTERKIPRRIIQALQRTLALDPKERPVSAQVLLTQLDACGSTNLRRGWFIVAGALALVAAAFLARGKTRAITPTDKSIAVLPFENLSADKENAYFASGVQDEVLSDLAKVADLKVISHTSVMNYPGAAGRNLREIAQALGVSFLVEGSVQRVGDRIRVTAQLSDARTDNQLWSEHYDRKVTDFFTMESEIAQEIADQLRSNLSPGEKTAIAEQPTADLKAYELYTEARAINVWENWQGAHESLAKKAALLRQAVGLDPGFALAHSALAKAECDLSEFNETELHLRAAKDAADAALHCARNQPESHRELARYYLHEADWKRARAEIAIARRALPSDSETLRISEQINAGENRMDEAVANLERAFDLDPRNDEVQYHLCLFYRHTHRYKQWEAHLARITASDSPQSYWFQLSWAQLKLDTGDLASAQAFLAQIPTDFSPTSEIWETRITAALYARDYHAASHIIALIPPKFAAEISVAVRPNTSLEGLIAHYRGDENAARAIFSTAIKQIDQASSQSWNEDELLADAAICDAGLGRKEKAVSEARRAVDLVPPEKNLRHHVACLYNLAMVYASLGEKELALDQLEVIAKRPTGPAYGDFLLNPCWDRIRTDSRFRKIVALIAPPVTLVPAKR